MLEIEVEAAKVIIDDIRKQPHYGESVEEDLWISKAELLGWKKEITESLVNQVTS